MCQNTGEGAGGREGEGETRVIFLFLSDSTSCCLVFISSDVANMAHRASACSVAFSPDYEKYTHTAVKS